MNSWVSLGVGGLTVLACSLGCGSEVTSQPVGDGGSGNGGSSVGGGDVGGGTAGGGVGGTPIDQPFSELTLAVTRVYLGDTNWDGSPNLASGWENYGEDIDGVATENDFSNHCQPFGNVAQGAVHNDGPNGIDNSWGQSVLPIVLGFATDVADQINGELSDGDVGHLLTLRGVSTADIATSVYRGTPLGSSPANDGSDCWSVAPELLSDPTDIASAIPTIEGGGFFADGLFRTGIAPPGQIYLLDLGSAFAFGTDFPVGRVRFTIELNPDTLQPQRGWLSGVIPVDEFIALIQQQAGALSPELCSGTTFESIANQMRMAADIMTDGTQDPNATCNGISLGLGFDFAPATLCGVGPASPPTPDPCAP